MTSVSFPFKVGTPGADKQIPLLDVEFRYTTKAGRRLEQACHGNIDTVLLRRSSVEAAVLLVCYGLLWAEPRITEDAAADRIDEFIAAGGSIIDLASALYKALYESGLYGKVTKAEGDANPTTATEIAASA